jgi:hypothetical protein
VYDSKFKDLTVSPLGTYSAFNKASLA